MFWGPRTQREEFTVEVGRDTITNLKGGEASVRVTAGRANSWWRSPAPVVQEISLPVRLTPPALQVTSIQTYAAQGGCEAVAYRVGESSVRDGVRSGGTLVSRLYAAWRREAGSVRALCHSVRFE